MTTRNKKIVWMPALLAIVLAAGLLTACLPPPSGPVWGYAWGDDPTTGDYSPSAAYSANSTGGGNRVEHRGTGDYTLHLPGLGAARAMAHVTAYGPGTARCAVGYFGAVASEAEGIVNVQCVDNVGAPADTRFTALLARPTGNPFRHAHVWGHEPSAATYAVDPRFMFNSTGGPATITRNSAGSYVVRLAGLGGSDGTVAVTANDLSGGHCKTTGWGGPEDGDQYVGIACFDRSARPANMLFDMTWTSQSLLGVSRPFAYVFADQPTISSYTPNGRYSRNSSGGTNTITRLAEGRYAVRLPGFGSNTGHVQVTAYGTGPERCKVGGWNADGGALVVDVRCVRTSGTSVDVPFTMQYVR